MPYIERHLDQELDFLMEEAGALAIEGPKGVGKTATAIRRVQNAYRLDDSAELELLRSQPNLLTSTNGALLIDEWQRLPLVWDLVRRAVDDGVPPGRFILTGSAAPMGATTHSGAGRILTVRMRPLSFAERERERASVSLATLIQGTQSAVEGRTSVVLEDYVEEICASGFPGMRGYSERVRSQYLQGYIDRIVDHDFQEMGHIVRRPMVLRSWLSSYAAATATTASYEKIRDAATGGNTDKPAKATTIPYRDILERMWILEPLHAWIPERNEIKQLASPPKHHLADPALAARLLGITPSMLLRRSGSDVKSLHEGTLLGALFESLVALSLRSYAQVSETAVYHLRTHGGEHEVDFVLVRPDGRIVAVEVKLSAAVGDKDVKQLVWLKNRLGADVVDAMVISTGPYAYRRQDGIAVVPLALLGA